MIISQVFGLVSVSSHAEEYNSKLTADVCLDHKCVGLEILNNILFFGEKEFSFFYLRCFETSRESSDEDV